MPYPHSSYNDPSSISLVYDHLHIYALIDVASFGSLVADGGMARAVPGRQKNPSHGNVRSVAKVVRHYTGTFIADLQVL